MGSGFRSLSVDWLETRKRHTLASLMLALELCVEPSVWTNLDACEAVLGMVGVKTSHRHESVQAQHLAHF